MPIWDLAANYTNTMIGYHAVPVIADAYQKGIRDYDAAKAFEAMKHSATRDHHGLESYKKYGFIPVETESESVSKTLEYAYDDWTIAIMAKSLGKKEDYKNYLQRAQYYKNLLDPSTNFMRGRFHNKWFEPFDPYEVNFNYTKPTLGNIVFMSPKTFQDICLLWAEKHLMKNCSMIFFLQAQKHLAKSIRHHWFDWTICTWK